MAKIDQFIVELIESFTNDKPLPNHFLQIVTSAKIEIYEILNNYNSPIIQRRGDLENNLALEIVKLELLEVLKYEPLTITKN